MTFSFLSRAEGCGAKETECGQSWTLRPPTRLVDTWSGGGTVPTYSSSSSEASGAPLKQPEQARCRTAPTRISSRTLCAK